MFNIVARKALMAFCKDYPEAAPALQHWYHEIIRQEIKSFNQLKRMYGSASVVGDDRVVFNIGGNKYRLVVRIVFEFKVIQIKWFGTHKEYDRIDVLKIKYHKR